MAPREGRIIQSLMVSNVPLKEEGKSVRELESLPRGRERVLRKIIGKGFQ